MSKLLVLLLSFAAFSTRYPLRYLETLVKMEKMEAVHKQDMKR
jgi:hypothetical protein